MNKVTMEERLTKGQMDRLVGMMSQGCQSLDAKRIAEIFGLNEDRLQQILRYAPVSETELRVMCRRSDLNADYILSGNRPIYFS